MIMSQEISPKTLAFLFNTQTKRRIPPLYMIFTKIGFLYAIVGVVAFGFYKNGFLALFAYFLVGKYIYTNEIRYRFYQAPNLFFIKKWIDFITTRLPAKPYPKMRD